MNMYVDEILPRSIFTSFPLQHFLTNTFLDLEIIEQH